MRRAQPAPCVVAIDRSHSMGAPGIFPQALALARQAIDQQRGERVALLAFDDRATVLAAPAGPATRAPRSRA